MEIFKTFIQIELDELNFLLPDSVNVDMILEDDEGQYFGLQIQGLSKEVTIADGCTPEEILEMINGMKTLAYGLRELKGEF